MKKFFLLTFLSTQVFAGFYGSVTATSNYDARGLSSSADQATVQGTLGWSHESGLHIDTFFSPTSVESVTAVD
ncbi:MAG: hypothetical protein H6622_07155 [Halobacteriovoraceae bacterium]|nr:hypothetical protein [Halobacteriovoraceae bacterium]